MGTKKKWSLLVWVAVFLAGATWLLVRPAHAQDTLRGAGPIHGYTGQTFDTRGFAYDYLVDGSLSKDDPAARKFTTLQAAYAAAPAGTPDKPTVIGIKPGVYLLHASESAAASLAITKNYITLLGLTSDRRSVVIADNRGNKEGATNNGVVLSVNATGFTAMNLTIVNFCNMDYDYPGDPSKDLKMRSPVITQAVALLVEGDKHVYSHVAVLSRLDTMFILTARSYFTHAYVEGTDDFIGGGQVGVFEHSEIYFPTGNGVMSASGITFIDTVFKAARGLEFYKGFRNPDTLIDCVLPVNTPTSRVAWMVWKAPTHQNVFSLTFHDRNASGGPAVIADSIVGPPAFTLSRELTAEQAKAFNPWNLLRATPNGPTDDWDPAHDRERYAQDGSDVFRMAVTGPPTASRIPGAGPFISPSVAPSIRTNGPGAAVGVLVSPLRARGTSITWSSASDLVALSATTGPSVVVTGHNTTARAEWVTVKAMAANGFYVVVPVFVEPAFIAAPKFTRSPVVTAPVDGKVSVSYTLGLSGHQDQSLISWSQCGDASCTASREVAVSRGNVPLRTYSLTPGDIGKYLRVAIQPRLNISDPGPAVTATAARPIRATDVTTTTINPDFRNFVPAEHPESENHEWTVIGTWTVSQGDNLVNGYGLRVSNPPAVMSPAVMNSGAMNSGAMSRRSFDTRPSNPHAALVYDNDGPVGDMQVKVVMTPEKTAGQGFGIAGSGGDNPRNQRADIFIKYDPRTRTGYSLRFWRTIQSAKECMFQLYRIDHGVGTPLNAQQELTGVFKPNTTITLTVTGDKLTVEGSNSMDSDTLSLEGTIAPNRFGGAGVYWSGSVPVGNSNVYSQIEITYPNRPKP